MADDKFKLPQSSYDELVKYIKAYSHISKPTDLNEISRLTGTQTTNISRNVGFLLATGILDGGKKKMPTTVGQRLGKALEHGMTDEISKAWRYIVEENEFLNKLLTSISIRNGMDSQTLEAHIAYSAGQPKKPQFMTGARTVIDILKVAELIVEVDEKYLLKDPDEIQDNHAGPSVRNETIAGQTTTIGKVSRPSITTIEDKHTSVQVSINININCTPDEVDGLGVQLRDIINEIVFREDIDGDE